MEFPGLFMHFVVSNRSKFQTEKVVNAIFQALYFGTIPCNIYFSPRRCWDSCKGHGRIVCPPLCKIFTTLHRNNRHNFCTNLTILKHIVRKFYVLGSECACFWLVDIKLDKSLSLVALSDISTAFKSCI